MTEAETAPEQVDVLIVGAGNAGLTAALLLAAQGLSVRLIDRAKPVLDQARDDADLRTTAILTPTVDALDSVGVWPALAPQAAELATMRMIDAGDGERSEPQRADFESTDLDRPVFGYNLDNTVLRRALLERVLATPAIKFSAPETIAHLAFRDRDVAALFDSGARATARLLVAADGRDSEIRARISVADRRMRYDQKALVFMVAHARPHGNASTEILRRGGPFTLVPHLDAAPGDHRSSVVWMESATEADRLMALPDDAFSAEAAARSLGLLGPLTLASRRMAWPMTTMLADRFHGPRVALIAEAAHQTPPIGAQGFNMSVKDATTLAELVGAAHAKGADIGAPDLLQRYTARRWPEVAARLGATAALNAAAIGAARPIRDLRRIGLKAIHDIAPLRRLAMRAGLG